MSTHLRLHSSNASLLRLTGPRGGLEGGLEGAGVAGRLRPAVLGRSSSVYEHNMAADWRSASLEVHFKNFTCSSEAGEGSGRRRVSVAVSDEPVWL